MTSAEPVSPAETPDLYGAFPRLDPQQLGALAANGRRRTQAGEVLYREVDRDCDFYAIAEGKVAVVEGYGSEERVIAVHGPGRFLGELGLLIGQPAFLTAVVREPGEVVVVPVDRLRQLVVDDPTLGDLILRAYLPRRSVLIELGSGFRIVGSRHSPDTRRLREFAARNRLPRRFIDLGPGSPAPTWPSGRSSRRRSSAPASACRPRRQRSSKPTGITSSGSARARRSPPARS